MEISTEQKKKEARKSAREARRLLSNQKKMLHSEEICNRMIRWNYFDNAESICFFYPLENEVDLRKAVRHALDRDKKVYFPRTCGEDMDFYRVRSFGDFSIGNYKIMEPTGEDRLEDPSPLVLTPGLAFDMNKCRIGYGKAYYDRFFRKTPGAKKVGVCFECQIQEDIPTASHDIRMDYLVTEGWIW